MQRILNPPVPYRPKRSPQPPSPATAPTTDPACPSCSGAGWLRRDVSIDHPAFGQLVRCGCQDDGSAAAEARRDRAWRDVVPLRMRGFRLATCPNRPLAAAVRRWREHDAPTGANLVVVGDVGRGKTGAAVGALREHLDGGGTVAFWATPQLLDVLRFEEFADKPVAGTLDTALRAGMLLLDDVGTERATPYAQERLAVLLSSRYDQRRPTIVTTNLNDEELEAHLGARVTSRLLHNCVSLVAEGNDYRAGVSS